MRTIRDADVREKRILLRADLNVPLDGGAVADDQRIRASLPTVRALREGGARAVAICSHLGRPKGADPSLSLAPVAARLGELLGERVPLLPDVVGVEIPDGPSLLENVRFHAGEERNDPAFAARLAEPFDLYVNDAFGAAHRAHASTAGVAALLPAYAGLLLEKEVLTLRGLLDEPARPFLAIVGGAKVSTKLEVLGALVRKVDALAVGGGMANTFLAAAGCEVGRSLRERDREDAAREIVAAAGKRGIELILPEDAVVASGPDAASGEVVDVANVPKDAAIVDAGPRTLAAFERAIARARTILWNGPLGVFENPAFGAGTRRVAELLAASSATTVVGGGESVQAVVEAGLADRMTHVSTGGGASLELIEGKTLPGVAAIPDG